MDFSKVRLSDFAHASLREDRATPTGPASVCEDPEIAEACAHAPQYTVRLAALSPEVQQRVQPRETQEEPGVETAQLDEQSRYALAVVSDGVIVWKQGSKNSLLFPLPPNHSVTALLIPANETAIQPGLVAVDRTSGMVTYWESVTRAVVIAGNTPVQVENDTVLGSESTHAQLRLGRDECIVAIECVSPIGLVLATNRGHFYLVNLHDEVGKRHLKVTKMSSGSGVLSKLRSLGTFARDVASIRAGRVINAAVREVYITNKFGDLALWHVGQNGYAELVGERRIGAELHMRTNMLYPNSASTLLVHDVAIEQDMTHVLASFAPCHDSETLFFVVMSLNAADFEVISVHRVQAYESTTAECDHVAALQVANGVLTVVTANAITFVDSPSRKTVPRWEESLALKPQGAVLGSDTQLVIQGTGADTTAIVVAATYMGFLEIHFSTERSDESTTQARLEQAVFESRAANPLDLTKWPKYQDKSDSEAPETLAVQITESRTPFLPEQLPNMAVHLDLRAKSLKTLYSLTEDPKVSELAQTVVAAHALWVEYERGSAANEQIEKVIKSSVREFMVHNVVKIPEVLDSLAQFATSARSKDSQATAQVLLGVLTSCDNSGLKMPSWATQTQGALRSTLDILTTQAIEAHDFNLLSTTVELLCAVHAAEGPEGADCNSIKQLLFELANMEHDGSKYRAMDIASKYRVYSALAPLEVGEWLNGGTIDSVIDHIKSFGDAYASAVFEMCISDGHSDVLVSQLASYYSQLVEDYLNAHKLHSIAWTLYPGTGKSTHQLELATKQTKDSEEKRVLASLFKLSSYFTKEENNFNEAELSLKVLNAQQVLVSQYGSQTKTNSTILKHDLLSLNSVLDRNAAVDLLALATPRSMPETNENFIMGFELVDDKDMVRQNLLVQQLVCCTVWDFTNKEGALKKKAFEQTLFFSTFRSVQPKYQVMLRMFRDHLAVPSVSDVKMCFPWDIGGHVIKELNDISQRAIDIANKFDVDAVVLEFTEEDAMDVDE